MYKFDGFTAYTDDEKNCFGLVEVHSNMHDLLEYDIDAERKSYSAEISFLENNCSSLVTPNFSIHLILRKDERSQACETWKLTGLLTQIPAVNNKLTISLSSVQYYVDGDEQIYWDVKYIHRIRGKDYMEETRKNLAME
jgi:hypothetical protein